MKLIRLTPAILLLGAVAAPMLQAQQTPGAGKGQQFRKRDGSCTTAGQGRGKGCGQGVGKQDGTGPRAGTAACPKTQKAPAK